MANARQKEQHLEKYNDTKYQEFVLGLNLIKVSRLELLSFFHVICPPIRLSFLDSNPQAVLACRYFVTNTTSYSHIILA